VVLVAVREHHADDVVEAVPDRLEVGQDQVDARLVLLWEEHADVDDEELAVELVDGHVATDLAEPAERDDAERAGLQDGRIGRFHQRVVPATLGSAPPAAALASGRNDFASTPSMSVTRAISSSMSCAS